MGEAIRPATGTTGQDPNAVYPLGSSLGESARLQRQAEELAADSAALLDRAAGAARDRPGLRPARDPGPAGRAGRAGGPGRRPGLRPGACCHGGRVRRRAGAERRGDHHRGRQEHRAAIGLLRPGARPHAAGQPARARRRSRRDDAAGPPGRLGGVCGTRHRARAVLPAAPGFDRLRDIFTVAFRRDGADPWIGRRVPSCSAGPDWTRSRWRRGCRCTRPATPGGPSAWTAVAVAEDACAWGDHASAASAGALADYAGGAGTLSSQDRAGYLGTVLNDGTLPGLESGDCRTGGCVVGGYARRHASLLFC